MTNRLVFKLSELGKFLGVQYLGTDIVDDQVVEHEERMRRYFAEDEGPERPPWPDNECLICGEPRDRCECTWHAPI